jgi:hypothetical protein
MLNGSKHYNFRSLTQQGCGFAPAYWSVVEIMNSRELPTDSPGVPLM